MAAYLIANLTVIDAAGFADYRAKVPAVIAHYGGRYLVRGGEVEVMEGDFAFDRLVILEFPTMAMLRAFYASQEYAPLIRLREDSTRSQVAFVDGVT